METGNISNEEAEALLSDEKIVTRKQSKADSVARKSNVNSDENVNQPAEVLKNQDTRGRQIASKMSKLSSLRLKFSEEELTFLDTKRPTLAPKVALSRFKCYLKVPYVDLSRLKSP